MQHYSTLIFDVGGTLLRFNIDALVGAYIDAGVSLSIPLELDHTRQVLLTLENELPIRMQQRQISLEDDNGACFWDNFYTEGFRRLGVTDDVSAPVAAIRDRFQRGELEQVYDDVVPALDALTARNATLGILSNFSTNCEDVLRQVGVHRYFAFFVVSACVGMEKPDPRIFDLTVQRAKHPREEIVYIGDSIFHDINGARQVGVDAILVDRQDLHSDYSGARIRDLRQLVNLVG